MQNILNKLAKVKQAHPKRAFSKGAKPNRVAVKLSVIDDINSDLDAFEDASSEASWLAYEWGDDLINVIEKYRTEIGQLDDFIINGSTRNLAEISERIAENLRLLEEKSNDLGIDPNELYSYFDELKSQVENTDSLLSDAYDKYTEVVEYSGVLNNFWK